MSHLTFLRRRKVGRLGIAFTPASLPGLLGHYDASNEPSVPAPSLALSPAVATMTDAQRLGILGTGPVNFTQSTPAAQPTLVSGQSPSCLPAYVPDGANTWMASSAFSFALGSSWTVFVVGNLGAFLTPEPFLYGGGGGLGLDFNLGGVAFKDANGTHVLAAAVGGWQRQVWSFDGTNGQITLTRNGAVVGQIAWTPVAFVPSILWRNGAAGAALGVSRLGEWGVYNQVFDTPAQAVLDASLRAKWFTLCV